MTAIARHKPILAQVAPPTVRLVQTANEWDLIERDWRALAAASPDASAALRWDWARQWWRIYGARYGSEHGLRIFTVWRGAALVGVLPLYEPSRRGKPLGVRRLRFLSTGEAEFEETCACYLDLLCLPGQADACLEAIGTALAATDCRWDELVLSAVTEDSPLVAWCQKLGGSRHKARRHALGTCYVSEIGKGLDGYIQTLGKSTRQECRRLVRSSRAAGVRLEVAHGRAAVNEYFQQLISLHQRRWGPAGEPGCFAAPRFREFHRALIGALVPTGEAVLARLMLGERPLAVFYGHTIGSRFELYVTGVERGRIDPVKSPGTATHLLLMSYLAAAGVTRYDHLMGPASSYKRRMGTHERRVVELSISRRNLRVAFRDASRLAHRSIRKGLKTLRLVLNPPAPPMK